MADAEPSPTDFREWLFRVTGGMGIKCEVCRGDSFNVHTDEQAPGLVHITNLLLRGFDRTMSAYFVTCTCCGNIKMFSGKVVRDAIADYKSKEE